MTFPEKLQKLRKEKNLSQEALAEAIGVSRQSVSKWELGSAKPDVDKLLLLSEYLQVSTDYLLKDQLEQDLFSCTGPDLLHRAEADGAPSDQPPACRESDREPAGPPHSSERKWPALDSIGFFLWILAILVCLFFLVTSGSIQNIFILGFSALVISAVIRLLIYLFRQAGAHAGHAENKRKK